MKKLTLLFCLLLLLFTTTHSQTLVNQTWTRTDANPSFNYKYYTAANNLTHPIIYIIGNTYTTTQRENFFIGKIDVSGDSGNLLWVQQYNGLTANQDFGIDISQRGSYIYVTGVSRDSATSTSQIVTLQLDDSTGTVNWSQTYGSGGNNIPTRLITATTGEIFVCGTANDSIDQGMIVLKYNSTGSLLWSAQYDAVGLLDAAAALQLDSAEQTLTVTGYSGNQFTSWNFVTLQLNATTGTIDTSVISSNGNGGFSRPVGIAKDNSGNAKIAGTAVNPANGHTDIKLISYDSQLHENWVTHWGDSTLHTEAVAMQGDMNGGLITLGTQTNADGSKEIVLLRHHAGDGTLDWARTLSASNAGEDAEAGALEVDNNTTTNIFITGSMGTAGHHRMTTACYDNTGNLLWLKEYHRSSTSDDAGGSIELDDSGNPMVTALSHEGSDSSVYVTVKYEQWNPSNSCDVSRSDCPTITYKFKNGAITSLGTDTFVEYDIYAKQSADSLPFYGGNIILTYSTDAFGNHLVDSNEITITRGTITTDTSYAFSLTDTLFNSDRVTHNGSEIWLSIAAQNTSHLYTIADTLQQLCHVKMKLKKKCMLNIRFDQFFMEDKSYYYAGGSTNYNYVYTGGEMALDATNIDLTYTISGVSINSNGSVATVNFDIMMLASLDSKLADAGVTVYYDPTVVQMVNYTSFSIAPWVSAQYSTTPTSHGFIYQENESYDNSIGKFTVTATHIDDSQTKFEPTDGSIFSVPHLPNPAKRLVNITMKIIDCGVDPKLTFQNPCLDVNDFADDNNNFILTNYNVILGSDYTIPLLCSCKTDADPCTTGINRIPANSFAWKAYPNPFENTLSINYTLLEKASVDFSIENILGQSVFLESWSETSVGTNSRTFSFPAELPSGIYIARLKMNNQWSTLKIIKE